MNSKKLRLHETTKQRIAQAKLPGYVLQKMHEKLRQKVDGGARGRVAFTVNDGKKTINHRFTFYVEDLASGDVAVLDFFYTPDPYLPIM
jgi:hypothetical protein